EEGEAFRNSASATLMEQGAVVQKLYSSIISRARKILKAAFKDTTDWRATVLVPLQNHILEHKRQIESRLEMLRRISASKEGMDTNIEKLRRDVEELERQLKDLQTFSDAIQLDFVSADAEDGDDRIISEAIVASR
ncbi:MAG: hypothetical protein ABFS02_11035, partial [Pseudomonadota bacterium]